MKKFALTLLVLLFCQFFGAKPIIEESASNKISQKSFKYYNALCEGWYWGITSNSLPKDAKYKTISFTDNDYVISGYFSKGNLTEGQILEISTLESETIIKGYVSYINGELCVEGIRNEQSEQGIIKTYGTFKVSNSANSEIGMSFNPKKAGMLRLKPYDIRYYRGYYLNCPTIVCVKEAYIAVDGETGRNENYNYFCAPLKSFDIKNKGYDAIIPLLMSVYDDAYYLSTGRNEYRGKVIPKMKDDGSIFFQKSFGEFVHGDKEYELRKENSGAVLSIRTLEYKDFIHMVPSSEPLRSVDLWNLSFCFEHMSYIERVFANGIKFSGQANVKLTDKNGNKSVNWNLSEGKLSYPNGDYFVGDLSSDFYGNFPINGTMHFKDGSSEEGNWLAKYDIPESQKIELTNKYPSDAKAAADKAADEYKFLKEYEGKYVDLGLSVKWATCNIGATRPEGYGNYYAWGELKPKDKYTMETYKFYKKRDKIVDKDGFVQEGSSGYTKYVEHRNSWDGYHNLYDDKLILDPEDDIAHVKLGWKWRMPSPFEFEELHGNCSCQEGELNGVEGLKLTSKKPGYTDKWIFLPYTGERFNDELMEKNSCRYWTNMKYSEMSDNAAYFFNGFRSNDYLNRTCGMPVRPVLEK